MISGAVFFCYSKTPRLPKGKAGGFECAHEKTAVLRAVTVYQPFDFIKRQQDLRKLFDILCKILKSCYQLIYSAFQIYHFLSV